MIVMYREFKYLSNKKILNLFRIMITKLLFTILRPVVLIARTQVLDF